MKMKPILFNTAMVRAILDGRKIVTRRVVKYTNRDIYDAACRMGLWYETYDPKNAPRSLVEWYVKNIAKLPYRLSDILYVRETWSEYSGEYIYKTHCVAAKMLTEVKNAKILWYPSIHMPKEAARIFLRVTGVRVERLQDITWQQAANEGCTGIISSDEPDPLFNLPPIRWNFRKLWDSTIKKTDLPRYSWAANPWVWVIEFERISKGEAQKGDIRS